MNALKPSLSMRELVDVHDWAKTPLGPQRDWPQSLKTLVRFMLESRYAMWMGWGPELTFFYNDKYGAETLADKHPWALGRPAAEVWSEIWSAIGPRIQHVLATGTATWDEGLMLFLERRGFSEETYHTFSYSPLYDDAGATTGMFCVVTEETERILGERRLAQLHALAAKLTSVKSVDGVFGAVRELLNNEPRDLPFTVSFLANDGTARLASVTGAARDCEAMQVPVTWPIDEVLRTGEAVSVDLSRFPDLQAGPWQRPPSRALVLPIAQAGQAPQGVFVAGINPHRVLDDAYRGFIGLLVGQIAGAIASATAYEEERAHAEALAELDRAKTAFFNNVSHELRTPLTLMLGPIEDVLADTSTKPASRVHLEIAHRNTVRLLKLVNSLLDFSRIEAGRMRVSYEAVDLAQLTADLGSLFRSAIERVGLSLNVDAPAMSALTYVDRDMWEKIVLNLVSNAFKYTMQGGIDVTVRRRGDKAELIVQDTGLGIPADELPHLFQRFHRVEGTRGRSHEGTGIGLALVQELVHLHGGTIRVDSTPAKGSTFTVSLPLGAAHLPADRLNAAAARESTTIGTEAYLEEARRAIASSTSELELAGDDAVSSAPGRFEATRGARIILADDNPDMRAYLSRLLRPLWRIETVGDGDEVLAAARRERPDLVLSDVMMPGRDGFGVVTAMRAEVSLRDVPIILLSARAGEASRVEGMTAGADDYLIKPFSARELVARVGAHLDLARVRRDASAALIEAQRRIDAALLAAEVGTYWWDIRNDRLYGDKNFIPMFGILADENSSAPLADFVDVIHPDDRSSVRHAVERTLLDDTPFEQEYRLLDGRGERWVIARGQVERAADGEAISWAGAIVDITARKAAEQRMLEIEREARTEAERIGRMKDEFLATLSHELRTPLNAMLGWTQILRHRQRPEDLAEGLQVIERNARNQAQLIEDLLDMSRIIAGKVRLDVQPVSLGDVINAAVDVVRPTAEAKGVRLLQTIDPQAGPVSGDPNRLQQVLWNLLTNAIKFTRNGGRVHVVLERVESHIEVTVADTGQGIAPDFLPHVFERFRQQDASTTRNHGGLGLGLAIVKQLVELHGGQVQAQSAGLAQGATFVVRLPLAAVRHDTPIRHPKASSEQTPTAAESLRLDQLRVLVVDNDVDAREILRFMLADVGADVTTVASATEAIEALEKTSFDLLVSDIGMPLVDGYDLIRHVRTLPPNRGGRVPAIAVTAFARSDDRLRALMAGYQMHIAKPFDPHELRTVCASLTNRIN